jgi:hypothetical protein
MAATKVSKSRRSGVGADNSHKTILFTVEVSDVRDADADAVALKYARRFYGADSVVVEALSGVGVRAEKLRPAVDEHIFVETKGAIKAPHVLFIGVPPLWELGYTHIRKLSADTLAALAENNPEARSLAMTLHGVNAGLDEVESAFAQFGGFLDSMRAGKFPPELERIIIVDEDDRRVKRLRDAFDKAFKIADYAKRVKGAAWAYRLEVAPAKREAKKPAQARSASAPLASAAEIEKAGTKSKATPHVFVAMPFKEEMNDVFDYGIQNAVHAAGYLCEERIDQESFTGDILDRVKKRIETSALVIADLTGDNPNVFLEVGYAWGKGRPTVLVVKDEPKKKLRFDVQGQRCIKYRSIKSLETSLTKMLKDLREDGSI